MIYLISGQPEEVFDKRPEEYYSEFEEGRFEPDIKGQKEFEAFLNELKEKK